MSSTLLEPAMSTELERSVVAVKASASDDVIGVGFFITREYFLTCSHVVEKALLRPTEGKRSRKPKAALRVAFPFDDIERDYEARVVKWTDPRKKDVATIELVSSPDSVRPLQLKPSSSWDGPKTVETYGFPAGYTEGVWAKGQVAGQVARKRLQINQDASEPFTVGPGFSGAPILVGDRKLAIGMVTSYDREGRGFYGAISEALSQRLPFEQDRGTLAWGLRELRSYMFVQLLNDLSSLERLGLDDRRCDSVQRALSLMVNAASEAQSTFWQDLIIHELEQFEDIYVKWNNAPKDSTGDEQRAHRRQMLRALREQKNKIRKELKDHQPLLANELDRQLIEDVYEAFAELSEQWPEEFPNVARAVALFQKKRP